MTYHYFLHSACHRTRVGLPLLTAFCVPQGEGWLTTTHGILRAIGRGSAYHYFLHSACHRTRVGLPLLTAFCMPQDEGWLTTTSVCQKARVSSPLFPAFCVPKDRDKLTTTSGILHAKGRRLTIYCSQHSACQSMRAGLSLFVTLEGRPEMSDVSPLSEISGLSFYLALLSTLLFFLPSPVTLSVLSFFCLLVHSPELFPENS